MIRLLESALVLVVAVTLLARDTPAQTVSFSSEPFAADTVHVAPPTGEQEADRASILAALDEVEPGGTVRFAAGTYLVGEIIPVPKPRITLLGHPDGTTLRGCDPSAFGDRDYAVEECNGLGLTGGHQTVRDLTFEHTWHALIFGGQPCEAGDCPPGTRPIDGRTGGYVVERSTFRESQNGIRVVGQWREPAVIRDNRFLNTYHAVVVNGMSAHVLDNHISVPEPERVPNDRHPGLALAIGGWEAQGIPACDRNVIAGNRIAGHPDAIVIMAFPESACRWNEIRGNTIEGARVRYASPSTAITVRDPADSTVVGAPVRLLATTPEAVGLVPGTPGEGKNGLIKDNLIEGNRILGAVGLAIEIVGNTFEDVVGATTWPSSRRTCSASRTRSGSHERSWSAGCAISPRDAGAAHGHGALTASAVAIEANDPAGGTLRSPAPQGIPHPSPRPLREPAMHLLSPPPSTRQVIALDSGRGE